MKNYSALLFALLFVFSLGSSSCSKKGCSGGGWYGDRNLGYIPVKKRSTEKVSPVIVGEEENDCEISNP
jgi:hypothetical protein